MAETLEPIRRLADMFRRIDGIGSKSALRMAYCVMNFSDEDANEFAEAILSAKRDVHLCARCRNLTTGELCNRCEDEDRDHTTICVVEDPRDVLAIEKMHAYHGIYQVLHGALSPSRHITPEHLCLDEFFERVKNEKIKEVILATNSTVEGETTAMYIARKLSGSGVKISRIANGVPVGGDLEYTDEITLQRALEGRYEMN